jgi:hypothetical protein
MVFGSVAYRRFIWIKKSSDFVRYDLDRSAYEHGLTLDY